MNNSKTIHSTTGSLLGEADMMRNRETSSQDRAKSQ